MLIRELIRRNRHQDRLLMRGRFIYARPSSIRGVARLFDFGGKLNTYSYLQDEDPNEADACAITSDWQAMGKDISNDIGAIPLGSMRNP